MSSNPNPTPNNGRGHPPTPRDLLPHIPIGHPDAMMSAESVRRASEEFVTRRDDVIVATFPKTGTTLVTWICHLLRTGAREETAGMDDVETFYELCPWPMLSWDIGVDPNSAQEGGRVVGTGGSPRIFKSHLRMASVYPGCRYVVTVRDPGRTALSFYNFFIAKRVPFLVQRSSPSRTGGDESGDDELKLLMDASAFLVDTPFVRGNETRASVWEYYAEYHALMHCPDVLMIVYEDFVGDEVTRRDNVRLVGKFMGVIGDGDADDDRDDDDLVERAAAMSTKSYMARYMSKFDEPYERAKGLGRAADVSQLAPGAKIALKRHGQTFDERATRFMDQRWRATMGSLGYRDYDSFCERIRKRNRELFGCR